MINSPLVCGSDLVPTFTPTPPAHFGYGRELAMLAKLYQDTMKFSGQGDSLTSKLLIFYDTCDRADVPPEAFTKAFPTMLKGPALEYYYHGLNSITGAPKELIIHNIVTKMLLQFENDELHRAALTNWNFRTLQSIQSKESDKTIFQYFELLVTQIRELRHKILESMRNKDIVFNKLIQACQGSPSCSIALALSPPSLENAVVSIRSCIVNYEFAHPTQTFYVDRTFRNSSNRGPRYGGSSGGRPTERQQISGQKPRIQG
ncbi:uncharacterized protein RCO7_09024 [Rhynchosporium graminicola]|uniref:Uncharacterized protein n=1 Tax=Rhynchosporium graminicola TaxID=2792576 RepID=A0A1E1KVC6_9HELO|nr:uncharacterized protein RCO7_09024 [Rhynchosporium commune]